MVTMNQILSNFLLVLMPFFLNMVDTCLNPPLRFVKGCFPVVRYLDMASPNSLVQGVNQNRQVMSAGFPNTASISLRYWNITHKYPLNRFAPHFRSCLSRFNIIVSKTFGQ